MRHWKRGALLGFAVLGAGVLPAGGSATAAQPSTSWPQETPGDALSRNLKALVASPHSVDALTGAGRAALAVGDAQAALGFLARAEDESPRDGRIKMWIGSALVQLEQPHAALKFFKDAGDLGVPEAEIARDRGLAHDLTGDQRRAQRDYRLALQRDRDPEIVRRLALSLAIGGDREQALRLLDEQSGTRNPAAERTRALVLALTGDAADAAEVVRASMPGPQGEALMPFLARLPALSPADRALAVHLGHFPQGARSAPVPTYAANDFRTNVVSFGGRARSPTDAGRPDPSQPNLGRTTASLVRDAPAEESAIAPPVRRIPTASSPSAPAPQAQPRAAPRTQLAARSTGRPQPTSWSLSRPALPPVQPRAQERRPAGEAPRQDAAAAPTSTAAALPEPASSLPAAAPAQTVAMDPGTEIAPPVASAPPAPRTRLAALAAAVATLPPSGGPAAAPHQAPARKASTALARKPAALAKKAEAAPSRQWVQLGIADDADALPGEFTRLKAKAGKLLTTRAAWTAPLGETNRLLVGPFASKDDAQEFVNQLAQKKLRAFAWTSPAGEKVAKLPGK
jgi:Flp pilus assembly protein TadD